ncbi:uncharacterized protein LOC131851038, partial [Achroia grisella]|uniref:uncharacterized protein LOC131851038 n=1 Tax=Achroia grisella TaxID=688607 RepID=UPI0027D2AE0D
INIWLLYQNRIFLFFTKINILVSILLCTIVAVTGELQVVDGRIKITTFTTAGCVDTVNFINDHLAPAYAAYKELLEIEFVPWGRTVRYPNGTYYYCQFQLPGCWANRLHRCVLNILREDSDAQMKYMQCEFREVDLQPSFHNGSYICAQNVGVSLIDVDYCMNNRDIDDLDDIAEEATKEPLEVIDFIPAIVFNDNAVLAEHNEALNRLESMLCFAFADNEDTGVSFCHVDNN